MNTYLFDSPKTLLSQSELGQRLQNGVIAADAETKWTLCMVDINNDGKYPFLKYVLLKQTLLNYMYLPSLTLTPELVDAFSSDFEATLKREMAVFFPEQTCLDLARFMGFYEYANRLYLFVDITDARVVLNDVSLTSKTWFAVIDELYYSGHVCDTPVHEDVVDFFSHNVQFCKLFSDDKAEQQHQLYETPVVGYTFASGNMVPFSYIFGETKKQHFLGKHYYFSLNMHDPTPCTQKNYTGCIRFALFPGNMKVITVSQFPTETATLISWESETHDSCFLRKIQYSETFDSTEEEEEKDSDTVGEVVSKQYILAMKEHAQQVPLSYHVLLG